MPRPTQPIVLSARAIQDMPSETFPESTPGGDVTWKTLLSSSRTPSNALTSGLARCPAKGGHLKCHRHCHPEIYYVVQGRGAVTIDGQEREVARSDVVFIPGDAEHGIRSLGGEEDLVWLYVFAADRFEDVVYRFSENAAKAKL